MIIRNIPDQYVSHLGTWLHSSPMVCYGKGPSGLMSPKLPEPWVAEEAVTRPRSAAMRDAYRMASGCAVVTGDEECLLRFEAGHVDPTQTLPITADRRTCVAAGLRLRSRALKAIALPP